MENIWKLIEKALGFDELHDDAKAAQSDALELKQKVEDLEKNGEGYVPKEYPKMLPDGKTVYSAADEAKATGIIPVSAVPVGDPEPLDPEPNADEVNSEPQA